MNNYRRVNNITGWLVFAVAAYTYISTIEPTGSFWDCGEFIATANKLEVGHPPGAPFFLLLARIFILFAGGNVKMIPIMVNILSALMSAFTILFLFWSITHMARKIIIKTQEYTQQQVAAVMAAGAVGALCYTFTDSFWFSAVEGEVYASSAFFTAIVFWAMLKWENVADEKHSIKWLILIAYLMGISIGVHLLNLLTIPALAFIYYLRKYPVTLPGIIYTSIIAVVVLGAIQFGIITGIVSIAASFDLFFVNTLGLPFNSGILVYSVLVLAGVLLSLRYSVKPNPSLFWGVFAIICVILLFSLSNSVDTGDALVKILIGAIVLGTAYLLRNKYSVVNTIVLCFSFIIIGYSSFSLNVIRAAADPPMDENNPENVFNFLSYLNREQYGDRPLFYGQYYTARLINQVDGAPTYTKVPGETKYHFTGNKTVPVYDPEQCGLLPRMYSSQASHVSEYKKWAGIKGDRKPNFYENMKFLFVYQLGEMYWRYFMWNFVGRQNDLQGPGGITKGNWESGIKFIDAIRLGPQDKIPESMRINRGRNHYFFLPFILGIIGLIFHFNRHKYDAWVVMLLFFFTGIAIVLYLNGPPLQPRERDYAYAGSFYAFAFWVGLGTLSLIEVARKKMPAMPATIIITLICLLAVPYVMAEQNWDDHDRSHRYTSRDFAYDYLNSCAPNAILFTNGDNDTFPLWYIQEVENVRTDVRVVNLSLLNTDWYIDQLKRKAYDSDPVPFSLTFEQYMQGTRDYMPFVDKNLNGPLELSDLMKFFVASEDPRAKVRNSAGEMLNYYPTKHFKMTIDKKQVLATGTVPLADSSKIVDVIDWSISENYLMKNDIMIIDLLANNNWKRPVYFATTVGTENFLNLEDYFQLEGLAYHFVPLKPEKRDDNFRGSVSTDIMYDNVMNKFVWGNMKDKRVYLDENNLRMTTNLRINTIRLTESLLDEGKKDSALAVLDKCMEEMPDYNVPYNIFMTRVAEQYFRLAGNLSDSLSISTSSDVELNKRKECREKGTAIVKRLAQIYEDNMNYYISLKGTQYYKSVESDINQAMYILQSLPTMLRTAGLTQYSDSLAKDFMKYRSETGMYE